MGLVNAMFNNHLFGFEVENGRNFYETSSLFAPLGPSPARGQANDITLAGCQAPAERGKDGP
jgi:hypothetical protein